MADLGGKTVMMGECHAHVAMDGVDYRRAMERHAAGPDERHIRAVFEAYATRGITFVRDGGDCYGVSERARGIATEYGIDYRSPLFAIHKRGCYGSIVGRGFTTLREYAALVDELSAKQADFVKIMTTGIMDFDVYGRIVGGDGLDPTELREMIHIAHEQGFAVMSHTNGPRAVLDAVEAGVDSIEHGNYLDDACLAALADTGTCFVPTATVARNLMGTGRFDEGVIARIWETSRENILKAADAGVVLAVGSDAGAVGVPHGSGTLDEFACFTDALGEERARAVAARGEACIKERFRRR